MVSSFSSSDVGQPEYLASLAASPSRTEESYKNSLHGSALQATATSRCSTPRTSAPSVLMSPRDGQAFPTTMGSHGRFQSLVPAQEQLRRSANPSRLARDGFAVAINGRRAMAGVEYQAKSPLTTSTFTSTSTQSVTTTSTTTTQMPCSLQQCCLF